MDARFRQEDPTDLLVAVRPADRSRRRRSRPARQTSRRPALLLSALLVGGLAAAGLGLESSPASAEATSVVEAEQALLTDDVGLEVKPQASVTAAEAKAR